MITTLNIRLDFEKFEWLEDKSCYNHNYYKMKGYGDWCSMSGAPILEEVCHEDENYFSFAIGNFDKYGDFRAAIEWNSDSGCSGIADYMTRE